MSVVDPEGHKVILERKGDAFWDIVGKQFAGSHPVVWKQLAMLALRENGEWTLERIGLAFGHRRGHVLRTLHRIKGELARRLAALPGQPETIWKFNDDDSERAERAA